MGDLQTKYGQLLDEVRYLESFLPKGLGKPRIEIKTIYECDISGFTSATQDALEQGQLATDRWIKKIGEQVYGAFDFLEAFGGNIQYHEGDAAVATFTKPELAIPAAVAVKDAINSLEAITLRDKTQIKLKIRQGIATGPVFTAVVGDDYRKIAVIDGSGVEQACETESKADPDGYVKVDVKTRLQTGMEYHFDDKNELITKPEFKTDQKTTTEITPQDYLKAINYLESRKQELLTYFPPFTRDEVQGKRTGKNEHATILFAKLPTLEKLSQTYSSDAEKLAEAYNNHFMLLKQLIEIEQEGEIDKLYRGKIIARFRGPKHQEQAETTALLLPRLIHKNEPIQTQLARAGKEDDKKPYIGYSSGLVYIGPVGTDKRKAFTMLGSRVNLAARLMAASKEHTSAISTDFAKGNKAVLEKELKGIGRTKIYTPTEENLTRVLKRKTLIGRDSERAQLASIIRAYYHNHKTQTLNIISDAGYGKTELTKEFERQFAEQAGKVYKASTAEQAKDIPDYLFQDFVRNALGIKTGSTKEETSAKIGKLTEETKKITHHWLGLNLGIEKPSQTGKELEEARRKTLLEIISDEPKLLIFNDVHWADASSLDRIEWLAQNLPNALITTNYRPKEISRELKGDKIELVAFTRKGIEDHVKHLSNTKDTTVLDFVEKQSQGNPLYIEEIVRYLQQQELLKEGKLTQTPEEIEKQIEQIGEGLTLIEKTVLQRYRNLRDSNKQTVLDYAACMFGEEFPRKLLEKALSKQEGELNEILNELQKQDFLRLTNGKISFRHNLTKNAVYNRCTTTDERVKRHTKIGDSRKELYGEGDDQVEMLAWDYKNGDDLKKAILSTWAASEKYNRNVDLDAMVKYVKDIHFLTENKEDETSIEYFGRSFTKLAFVYELRGELAKSRNTYAEAIKQIQRITDEQKRKSAEWKAQMSLARVLSKEQKTEEAIQKYDLAYEIANSLGEKWGVAHILNARSTMPRKNYEPAIADAKQAVQIFKDLNDMRPLIIALNNLGTAYINNHNFEQAIEPLKESEALNEQIKNKNDLLLNRLLLEVCCRNMGDYDNAMNYIQQIEKDILNGQNIGLTSNFLMERCRLAVDMKDKTTAQKVLEVLKEKAKSNEYFKSFNTQVPELEEKIKNI